MSKTNKRRRLIIGDIHGCYRELLKLLYQFSFNSSYDQVYSVGDTLNKGPSSPKTLQILKHIDAKLVLGNHEALFLHILKKKPKDRNSKEKIFLDQFHGTEQYWYEYLKDIPLWRDLGDLWIVHAGLQPGTTHPHQNHKEVLITIRSWNENNDSLNNWPNDAPWFEQGSWEKQIIFGHWASMGLVQNQDYICLDTGCVYGGYLSAWCPEENKLYQVQAEQEYCPIIKPKNAKKLLQFKH